jgi:hypothetical protein
MGLEPEEPQDKLKLELHQANSAKEKAVGRLRHSDIKKILLNGVRLGILGFELMKDMPNEESDWKRFRRIVPALRERYLREQTAELGALLQRPAMTPTENFWATSDRVDKVKRVLTSCLDDHKRSRLRESLMLMVRHGMMTEEDLEGFSEELQGSILAMIRIQRK